MKKIILIGLVALQSAALAQVPTANLLDQWEFNNSLTSGNSVNPLNATNQPVLTSDRCGQANSAVSFNGTNQFLKYPAMANIPLVDAPRSVSFWMKSGNTASGNSSFVKSMFTYGRTRNQSGQDGGTFQVDHNYCANGVGLDVSNQAITRQLTCLTNNVWHHVVAIWNSPGQAYSNVVFWVDGTQLPAPSCQNTGNTQLMNTLMSAIFMGCNEETPASRFYQGDLDDFYFYDRALTNVEVLQLFNDKCSIIGPPSACPNQNGLAYSTSPLAGATYVWSAPSGWNIVSGQGTSNITINTNGSPVGGNVMVTITTGCGTLVRSIPVTVDPPSVCSPTVLPSGCCLGNQCGQTQNALPTNYEVPMNSNNFYFSGDVAQKEKVNVGPACSAMMPGKFNVSTAVDSDPNGSGNSYSIYGINTNMLRNSTNAGVYGNANVSNGEAGNNNERGVWGVADGGIDARGVFGQGNMAFNSYGGYFESLSQNPLGTNYGMYASAANGNINWAGFFQGDINVIGAGYANYLWAFSDRRFKKDIKPLGDVTEKILKINGYNYGYRCDEFKERNFDKNKHIGFIAQEIKEVFPELVSERDGYLAVNYQGMVPVLLESAKEQHARIESLQAQVDELKALVLSMAGVKTSATSIPVSLSDKNAVVLNQNVPNPFAESTVISYNIPSDFGKAQIIFTTNGGVVIKAVDITVKGPGTLNVFANDLSHGLYSYTLVIDGKTVDTKKMIKE